MKVPYDIAAKVFEARTLPTYAKRLVAIYDVETLPPGAVGGLLSLVYNRGNSIAADDPRRKEMRMIKEALEKKSVVGPKLILTVISEIIKDMKRLWPTVKGLRDRRDAEAALVSNAASDTSETVEIHFD